MKPRHGSRTAAIAVALAAALGATLAPSSASAQEAAVATPIPDAALTPEELEKLVARIALYPDDLVALVLPASTNPLQIVQAERYLAKRKADPKAPLDDKWDDSVKSLLNYPEVITAMSNDLDWTAALGEAVVADQGEVLEAVQTFRRKTQAAGNLKTDPKQTVVVEKEVIKIVPTDPQVIYVPQYNPTTVVVSGGYSAWGYYPSPYPVYYYPYPPGAALATGLIWGAAIGAAWNGGHWGANYGGNNNININRNTNINTGNTNIGSGNRPSQGGGSSQWKSNKQPGQVSKSVGATPSARTGDRSGGGGLSSTSARQTGGAGGGAGRGGDGAGVSNRSSGGGAGAGAGASNRAGGGAGAGAGASAGTANRGGGGGGAFDGYGSGRQTHMDSSRGASSRSSVGASSSMSSRGGGGGGGRGGGGGGRGGGGRR